MRYQTVFSKFWITEAFPDMMHPLSPGLKMNELISEYINKIPPSKKEIVWYLHSKTILEMHLVAERSHHPLKAFGQFSAVSENEQLDCDDWNLIMR